VGFLPGDKGEQLNGRLSMLDLALRFTFSSDVALIVFKQIAKGSGADETSENQIAKILKMMALLNAILAALYGNPEAVAQMLTSFKKEMGEGLNDAQQLIDTKISKGASDEPVELASSLVQQGKVSLEEEDFESFMNAYAGFSDLLGLDSDSLKKEFKELKGISEILTKLLTSGLEDETAKITTVSQAM
jgi:hypothetical protein